MILGIGGETTTGKTIIANFIKNHYSVWILHLDNLAKELYWKAEVKEQIKNTFGLGVFNSKQEVNLTKIRKIFFKDNQKLDQLNKIMFPFIQKKTSKEIQQSNNHLKIIEGSILFQANLDKLTDVNILITSKREKQMERNQKDQKFKSIELKYLLKEQNKHKISEKKNYFIIENNESITKLENKIKQLINKLNKKYKCLS